MKIIFQHKSEQKDSVWWRSPLCAWLHFMTVPVSCPYKSPSGLKSSTSPADTSPISKKKGVSKKILTGYLSIFVYHFNYGKHLTKTENLVEMGQGGEGAMKKEASPQSLKAQHLNYHLNNPSVHVSLQNAHR